MTRKLSGLWQWALVGVALLVALGAGICIGANREVPGELALDKCSIKIVGEQYIKELEGDNANYEMKEPDKYRGLVLTLEIQKPAGEELTLHAQDMPLHYWYGEDYDVAPCQGLSSFSSALDSDRTMSLWSVGRGKKTTGSSSTKASTVYIDAFYDFMEPTSREMNILIAQSQGITHESEGWEP